MIDRHALPRFDAVLLAGGRARRLDGADKPLLVHRGTTLLAAALAAAHGAERTVVAGPVLLRRSVGGALLVQDDPPFGGPVAGLAAALPTLERPDAPEWVLVLATDLVGPAPAVHRLLTEAARTRAQSLLAVDANGRTQQLLGVHRRRSLSEALRGLDTVDGASVRAVLAGTRIELVGVPAGSTDDVDSPADARRHGIDLPRRTNENERMDETRDDRPTDDLLSTWWDELCAALGLGEVPIDRDALLALAGDAAHAVVRPAAPLTTFLAGYAAGLQGGGGSALDAAMATSRDAIRGRAHTA
ncbi:NTP transferase domain-containing protein [Rathayibacter tanaceti]|uniref:Molybdopterin-guanine dinucleotide biosynthesis protein MobA n=2 Tax=Rathayibacter tanaceti TaxID=1671680 RepID=A0A166H4U9_9MICO|nr:NTP transferase domain-containing protein [Rathayibacter tanaceti]KZX19945.1 molybdopterin-guanine dinucleotide biosynthesis protein MobA [Rathayibacter tanaceti]QHC54896.1 NTP transferase domain-containing protein [Rathayibacter tanaceti]TCO38433.1 molybdopterin-guanine dinucleotide biosynthesis protein A [Rathayibacter tanaceti]